MNDTPRRQRRSPLVVVLDGLLNLAAKVQAGPMPKQHARDPGSGERKRGAGRLLLVAGVLAAVGGTVLLIAAFIRTPAGQALLPDSVAAPAVSSSRSAAPSIPGSPSASRTSSPTPSASPTSRGPSRTTPPNTPGSSNQGTAVTPLTARYAAVSYVAGLLGYRATVTVTNPGTRTRDGWLLTVTLPRSTLMVSTVSGATAVQNGRSWTFTPDNSTVRITAGASVQVVYEVRGATLVDAAPDDCRVDGNGCAGVAEG